MQVSVEATTSIERRLTITVPAEQIDSAVDKKVQEAAKTVRLDGFRKGKVPTSVVKKRFGTGIRQDVISDVIQTSYFDALKENDINPAGMPEIESKEGADSGDFSYIAVIEIYPEIALAEMSALRVERQSCTITDTDVDTMIDSLRKQQSNWVNVDTAAQDGSQVTIDFEGYIDGEVFDGGSAEGHELILGSNSMIPGFEDGIVGMSVGEAKDIVVNFPEDYQAEHLAGKEATFKITLHKVCESELPELNEDFYTKFGPKVDNEESFRKEIRINMERELNGAIKSKLKNSVLESYLTLCEFDAPKALIKDELSRLKQQAIQQFGGGNQNLDPSELPDEMFQDQADKRVKVGLLAQQIIKSNELKADDERINALIAEMAQGYESPDEFISYYKDNQEQRAHLESVVLENMVVEHILANSQVTDIEVDYETAVKPAAQGE